MKILLIKSLFGGGRKTRTLKWAEQGKMKTSFKVIK